MKGKYSTSKHMGCTKSSFRRKAHSDKCLHEGKRKNSNKQPTVFLKTLANEETKLKVNRRKSITKIRMEINEIKTKRK